MPQDHPIFDAVFLLGAAALVLLMQAGFGCLESGLVRSKNTLNVAIKNMADFCLSGVLFWMFGFGIMFGATQSGLFGSSSFFLTDIDTPWHESFFLFQLTFCGAAVTIASGAVAERIRFSSYLIITVIISAFLYPLFGHWAWGGAESGKSVGWLSQLGFIDFAGSTVVHSVGGWFALACVIILGPRVGRFGKSKIEIQKHSIPLAMLGVFILWVGWFGFNGGSTLTINDQIPKILINTILSGLMGGLSVLFLSWKILGRPKAELILNGVLTGLVGITASCHMVTYLSASIIGAIAGAVSVGVTSILERYEIDDVVGAFPVHTGGGVWGTLAVALFGNPEQFKSGFGFWDQLLVQALGVGVCFLWAFGLGFVLLWLTNLVMPLRVSAKEERIGLDVSEHSLEQLNARIENDEALVNAVVQNLTDGIVTIDNNGQIQSLNPAAENQFGYWDGEIIDQSVTRIVRFPQETVNLDYFKKYFLAKGKEFQEISHDEAEGVRKDGSVFPIEITASRMNLDGHPLLIYILRDITERNRAKEELEKHQNHLEKLVKELNEKTEELQERETHIKAILDNAMDGIITIDEHGIVQSFNLAAENVFGYSIKEVIGKNINQLMPEPDKSKHDEYMNRYLSGGEPQILGIAREVIAKRKDGSTFPMELSVSQMYQGDSSLFIGIVRDIEERTRMRKELEQFSADLERTNKSLQKEILEHKKAEEDLVVAKMTAEKANAAKSIFLANMSHEIRTPMNAVFGYSQILKRDKGLNGEQKKSVENIISSGQHLLELINDILDISKIEAGRIRLNSTDFSLNNLMSDLSVIFKLRCDEKKISWNINRSDNGSNWVKGDAGKIKQILINLLGNAVKFTESGEITLNVKKGKRDIFIFEVIDTGPGIPPEALENIFEPFRQSEQGIKKGGTGLGLAISEKQAELMDGKLTVISEVNKGSQFTLNLPLLPAEESTHNELERGRKISRLAKGQSLKALIVEDLELNRDVLKKLLLGIGVDVEEAENGMIGCEKVKTYKPDIIFMDIRMPVMDGFEAINNIRSQFTSEELKIVIVTASALAHEQEDYEKRADSFIFKPFQAEEIFECIYKLMNVEFEYEEVEKEPDAKVMIPVSDIDFSNTKLLKETFQKLRRAAKSGNVGKFEKIIGEIEPTTENDQILIKQFLAKAKSYNLKEVAKILEEHLDE